MKPLYVAILLTAAVSSRAETINVLGQPLTFSNPAGYCTLGDSPRERQVWETTQRAVAPGARIVHAAVACTELGAFKSGSRDEFDHWLQIQLLGPKGQFKRLEVGREAFLSSVAAAKPRIDPSEIERRLRASFADQNVDVAGTRIDTLGRDGNAVYFTMRADMSLGGRARPIHGLGAVTLLNSLPVSVVVYEGTGIPSSRTLLRPTLQELLKSLLSEN